MDYLILLIILQEECRVGTQWCSFIIQNGPQQFNSSAGDRALRSKNLIYILDMMVLYQEAIYLLS
jgi:hypothetical protein